VPKTTKTKKPENQECGGEGALVGPSACCIHTQPSSSITQHLALCTSPAPDRYTPIRPTLSHRTCTHTQHSALLGLDVSMSRTTPLLMTFLFVPRVRSCMWGATSPFTSGPIRIDSARAEPHTKHPSKPCRLRHSSPSPAVYNCIPYRHLLVYEHVSSSVASQRPSILRPASHAAGTPHRWIFVAPFFFEICSYWSGGEKSTRTSCLVSLQGVDPALTLGRQLSHASRSRDRAHHLDLGVLKADRVSWCLLRVSIEDPADCLVCLDVCWKCGTVLLSGVDDMHIRCAPSCVKLKLFACFFYLL
jgi:hypothetical protein